MGDGGWGMGDGDGGWDGGWGTGEMDKPVYGTKIK
jgi:hypothetical protein